MVDEKKFFSYKDLRIWKKGMDICKRVYLLSRDFPEKEIFGVVSDLRRTSILVCSNISDGKERNDSRYFLEKLYCSISSLNRLETLILLSKEMGFVSEKEIYLILAEIEILRKMIFGFMKLIR